MIYVFQKLKSYPGWTLREDIIRGWVFRDSLTYLREVLHDASFSTRVG